MERFVLLLLLVEVVMLGYIGRTGELTRLVLVSRFTLVACPLAFAFEIDEDARSRADTTVLSTFTASPTWPETSTPIPPVLHLDQLLASRGAARTALSRALRGVDR